MQQIEADDAYIRDLSYHSEPDAITSEWEAGLARAALEDFFQTISSMVGDSKAPTNETKQPSNLNWQ